VKPAGRLIIVGVLTACVFFGQNKNQIDDRGQTRPKDVQGKVETRGVPAPKEVTVTGVLVDAGCADRTLLNLEQPSDLALATTATQRSTEEKQHRAQQTPLDTGTATLAESGSIRGRGITVDRSTAQAEREDELEHQVPDLRMRQPDPSCAITGATRGFAFLLPDGRLVNLDEGANTYAMEAIMATPGGRAMMNGTRPGLKLRAQIRGRLSSDRLAVDSLTIQP